MKKGENFFEPIHKQKLKTMANMKKSVELKTTQNKLIEFRQQGNIITKLLVKSQEEISSMIYGRADEVLTGTHSILSWYR